MNEGPQFSLPGLGRRRSFEPSEIETLLELLPQPALVCEAPAYRILAANSRAVEASGYARPEFAGLDLGNIFTRGDKILVLDLFWPGEREAVLIRKNASRIDIKLKIAPLNSKSGKHLLVQFQPSLIKHSAEQEAASTYQERLESLQRLVQSNLLPSLEDSLGQALGEGSTLLGADNLAVYLSMRPGEALNRVALYGKGAGLPEQLPAQDLIQLRTPHLWRKGRRPAATLHQMARAEEITHVISSPLGEQRAVIGLLVASYEQGEPVDEALRLCNVLSAKITNIIQQNSRLSTMNAELKELNHWVEIAAAVENSLSEGLMVLAPNQTILRINPAAERLLEYTSLEVLGELANQILYGVEGLDTALDALKTADGPISLGVVNIFARYGDVFPARLRLLPLHYNDHIEWTIILFEDMSEREQIRKQAQQLEEHALLGETTSVFAHEVRNPINNISMGLQNLEMALPEETPYRAEITRMLQDLDRLEELMKSVLAFSRPMDFVMDSIELGPSLKRLVNRQESRFAKANVQPSLDIEEGLPCIQGNLRALEQVFTNLITNAVNAMGERGGQLAVRLQKSQPHQVDGTGVRLPPSLLVSVADTGPGIPREIHEQVFKPFFTTNRTSGTGLGLAIAKRIINAHHGAIWLNSVPGGTVFMVSIPLPGPKPEPPGPDHDPPPPVA